MSVKIVSWLYGDVRLQKRMPSKIFIFFILFLFHHSGFSKNGFKLHVVLVSMVDLDGLGCTLRKIRYSGYQLQKKEKFNFL